MMHVQFTQDWGGFKSGQISDEMSDGVGEALVKAGQATRSDPMAYMRSSIASDLKKMQDEVLETVKTGLQTTRSVSTGPPNGGGQLVNAIQTQTVRAGESPVEPRLRRSER